MGNFDEVFVTTVFGIGAAIRALDQLGAARTEAMNLAPDELNRKLDDVRRKDLYGMRLDEIFHRYDHHRREAERQRVFKRLEVGDLLLPEQLRPARPGCAEAGFNNPNFFWYAVCGGYIDAGFDRKSGAQSYAATMTGAEILHRSEVAVRYPQYAARVAAGAGA